MLGNQESQGEPQDQLASHLEPDQEVAAVLGTGETTWCRSDMNYNNEILHMRAMYLPLKRVHVS